MSSSTAITVCSTINLGPGGRARFKLADEELRAAACAYRVSHPGWKAPQVAQDLIDKNIMPLPGSKTLAQALDAARRKVRRWWAMADAFESDPNPHLNLHQRATQMAATLNVSVDDALKRQRDQLQAATETERVQAARKERAATARKVAGATWKERAAAARKERANEREEVQIAGYPTWKPSAARERRRWLIQAKRAAGTMPIMARKRARVEELLEVAKRAVRTRELALEKQRRFVAAENAREAALMAEEAVVAARQ